MNQNEFHLQRLFRAASRVAVELPAEAPFRLEARILADWRGGCPDMDFAPLLLALMQKAFLCACAILLICAALILHSRSDAPANELVDVDSAIQLTLMR